MQGATFILCRNTVVLCRCDIRKRIYGKAADFADADFVSGPDSDSDGIIDNFDDDPFGHGFSPFASYDYLASPCAIRALDALDRLFPQSTAI